ncbi:MAG: hypothetical protein CMK92_03850 [Pseudomonas sp.]|nr:hypothetical protein [Pseudomonas sp.]
MSDEHKGLYDSCVKDMTDEDVLVATDGEVKTRAELVKILRNPIFKYDFIITSVISYCRKDEYDRIEEYNDYLHRQRMRDS